VEPTIESPPGWNGTRNQRDCRLVAIAGIFPDIDGLGMGLDITNEVLGRKESVCSRNQNE
jgi:hypothetical protein